MYAAFELSSPEKRSRARVIVPVRATTSRPTCDGFPNSSYSSIGFPFAMSPSLPDPYLTPGIRPGNAEKKNSCKENEIVARQEFGQ